MSSQPIEIKGSKKSIFLDKVKEILPEGGNLNLCLTCGDKNFRKTICDYNKL